uniref:GTP 3',8-cyclase n=1 Tax=Candidatus Methanophaga sp. ANME-1 ERB7 TaxID=2759913 RepID=A0A7G9Z3Z6_9EURY|nr:GTP 3',8-cyclase [Methanosarcinales archaeon ANME-1 ERB7]
MKEAMFYEKLEGNAVRCLLCPHQCKINESRRGICGVRENRGGVLYSLVYGKVIARGIDPIEKKPFFHFYPGSEAYSIATVGCNFRCKNCQNFEISQMPKEGEKLIVGEDASPEEIVAAAKQYGCRSIAYTYTEPTIFFEFAYDTARLAHKEGIGNTFITNGHITEEAIRTLVPYLDAVNVDLKGLSEDLYQKICGGHLKPVQDAIKLYKSLGVWVEVTTLVIPTLNDFEEEFRGIAEFIKSVGVDIPWHISQFYPTYKLTHLPPTPVTTLREARGIGLDVGLRYVYEGNVPGEGGENTYCYQCGELLIRRYGFQILENKIQDSRCPSCGARIDGIL